MMGSTLPIIQTNKSIEWKLFNCTYRNMYKYLSTLTESESNIKSNISYICGILPLRLLFEQALRRCFICHALSLRFNVQCCIVKHFIFCFSWPQPIAFQQQQ